MKKFLAWKPSFSTQKMFDKKMVAIHKIKATLVFKPTLECVY